MKSLAFIICFLFTLLTPVLAQKKVTVHVTPEDATIYEIVAASKELKELGVGTAVVVVQKNSETMIVVQKSGFADLKKVYSTTTGEKLPKDDFLFMKDRMVNLKVSPDDAKIIVNGNELEKGVTKIILKEGQKVTVEVKKAGYVSVNKTYLNQPDADLLPATDEIKLKDRIIQVVSTPSDAKILVDNQLSGTGHGDVVVPFDHCVVVKVVKEGYVEAEQTYCNKEGVAELPSNASFALQDRLVIVRTTPEDVTIKINGRYVAKGEYNVKIVKGDCVEVTMEKDGSVAVQKKYCNQDNAPLLPVIDHIDLLADETFAVSSPSEFVNINNVVEINQALKDVDAWKAMSQVVMNYFDVIEVTDKVTGYLRTAWAVKTFPNNTIRTRIIIKVADSSTLKYVVKLCSEYSGKSGSNANDDSLYSEWHRVLEMYKNVITDIQARLK